MTDYQQTFDSTVQRIQGLDDSALMGKRKQRSVATFLSKNGLSGVAEAGYQRKLTELHNILNFGDSEYADRNQFDPLCEIGDNIVVGNYTGYRAVTGANVALSALLRTNRVRVVKIRLLQSYVVCKLPKDAGYLEIIYRKNHLGPIFKPAGACEYQVGAVFDKEFVVLAPEGQALAVQQLLSPDVQATLLDYPRNIGISGEYLITTFGGRFYSEDPYDKIKGQQPGDVKNQILDSYLIFQQILEQLDGSYKVKNSYKMVQVQQTETTSLKSNRRKRIIASTISAVLLVVIIGGYILVQVAPMAAVPIIGLLGHGSSSSSSSGSSSFDNPEDAYVSAYFSYAHAKGDYLYNSKYLYISSASAYDEGGSDLNFNFYLAPHKNEAWYGFSTSQSASSENFLIRKIKKGYEIDGIYASDENFGDGQNLSLTISYNKKVDKYQKIIGYTHDPADATAKGGDSSKGATKSTSKAATKTAAANSSANASSDDVLLDTPVYLCSNNSHVKDIKFSY